MKTILSTAALVALCSGSTLWAQEKILPPAQASTTQTPSAQTSPAKPSPDSDKADLYYYFTLGHSLEMQYEATGRAELATQSIDAYKKALDIRRQLAKINPAYQPSLAVTLYDVGDLYNDTGQAAQSEAAYQEALDIFRQAAKANLTTYQPYVAGMLYMLALVHIAMKNLPQAKMEIEECVDINRKRSKANPEAGDDLARSLIIATVTQQESTRKCELASEAASVAQSPQLKDLAIKKKASVCTLE